jgi:hypothetical protein
MNALLVVATGFWASTQSRRMSLSASRAALLWHVLANRFDAANPSDMRDRRALIVRVAVMALSTESAVEMFSQMGLFLWIKPVCAAGRCCLAAVVVAACRAANKWLHGRR